MTVEEARAIAGTLSYPSKMPCASYSIPASNCFTGRHLHLIKGSVCENCYALKGRYLFGNVQRAMQKRLDSLSHPRWVEAMVTLIEAEKNAWFRWHDSGDLQSMKHLDKIVEIAELLPEVHFWLPTKERKLVERYFDGQPQIRPLAPNLTIRFSMPMVGEAAPARHSFGTFAEVHRVEGQVNAGAMECISRTQGHKCLACRACWDTTKNSISYLEH